MPVAQYADGTNGNVALPANSVTRQQLIDWGASLQAFAGTGLAAVEGLNATGLVVAKVVTPGLEEFSTAKADVWAAVENAETLAAAGSASVSFRTTKLNAAAGAFALTFPNGTFDGQEKFLQFSGGGASTAEWTASGLANLRGFSGFKLNKVSHSGFFRWDGTEGKWAFMGGNLELTP